MRRFFSLLSLSLWCIGFAVLASLGWVRVVAEFFHQTWWLMALMFFISLGASIMLVRFLQLWRDVFTGHLTPRLAGRVVRNILADGLFFFKTGWKG